MNLVIVLPDYQEMMTGLKEGYDAILASRHTEGSKINRPQSFIRTLLGWAYRITVRTFFLKNIRDPNCGFKGFRSSQIKKILPYLTINRYVCDVELLYLPQCHQMAIKEHGVQWNHQPHSKVFPFRDSLFSLLELLKLSFHILRGDYKV